MESAYPPSYEEATTKNHWLLVAEYISGSDLCAACLVSRDWHATFAPFLWGNPAGHFGTENDRVYVASTRFKRALPTASLNVRQLTHTLHLPPALSEIYDGPKAEWLRDVLERLPNLQSLLVSQLPFFDHAALLALRRFSRSHIADGDDDDFPRFPLRLLIASKCSNATSAGLAEALLHLPRLVFLDLSETIAARDSSVLKSLRYMQNLQVLKLRSIGLRDDDVLILAEAIKIRVRSLDVGGNRLTDVSVRTLLSECFHPIRDVHSQHSQLRQSRRRDSDWPSGVPVPDDSLLIQLQGNDLDERFLQRLTKPGAGRIISEDLPPTGLTHLYISDNFISVEGISSLIRTENLYVLDAAAIDTTKALSRPRARSSLSLYHTAVPGAEKLTPLLEKHGKKNLTFLRINHSIVTQPSGPRSDIDAPAELEGGGPQHELDLTVPQASELESFANSISEIPDTAPVYEMSAEAPSPRYELPTEPPYFSNPFSQRVALPQPTEDEEGEDPVRRGSAFAPEVATNGHQGTEAYGTYSEDVNNLATEQLQEGSGATRGGSALRGLGDSVAVRIAKLEQRRLQLRRNITDSTRGLLPGSLPSLRTLVLTDVPQLEDSTGPTIGALQSFILDCAVESDLALAQASLEFPSIYVPGKPRSTHKLHRSRELFGLRQIVLELSPHVDAARPRLTSTSESSGSPLSPQTPGFRSRMTGFNQPERSSTGDPDTESFWRAQENDFSFFGEEECGQPLRDPGSSAPRRTVEEKMAVPPEFEEMEVRSPVKSAGIHPSSVPQQLQVAEGETRDVVAELARWRRGKKQFAERSGTDDGAVDGHWRGEIKIVRPEFQKQKGYIDWYGNYFEKGVHR